MGGLAQIWLCSDSLEVLGQVQAPPVSTLLPVPFGLFLAVQLRALASTCIVYRLLRTVGSLGSPGLPEAESAF